MFSLTTVRSSIAWPHLVQRRPFRYQRLGFHDLLAMRLLWPTIRNFAYLPAVGLKAGLSLVAPFATVLGTYPVGER